MDRFVTRKQRSETPINVASIHNSELITIRDVNNVTDLEGHELEITMTNRNQTNMGHSSTSNDQNEDTPKCKKRKFYKQHFKNDWRAKYGTWLVSKENRAYCKACEKFINGGKFHIDRHEQTMIHIDNWKKCKITQKIDIFVAETPKTKLQTQIEQGESKLVMFLHEHNLPFLLMDHLPKMIESVCPDSEIAKSLKISRTKATALTKDCFALEALELICEEVSEVPAYSLIMDETTDVSMKKSLAILLRYHNGDEVKDKFLVWWKFK